MPPRVRIAPSPTGDPHVGTAYVGLFNYAFARKHGGSFVLRIEDTDRARSSSSSERAIFAALQWLGLNWDEGPDKGGPYGPYRQSERLDLYRRYVEDLIARGEAYPCFCSRERLESVRRMQMAEKKPLGYDRHCRDIAPTDARKRVEAGESHVVRLQVPLAGETVFRDELRGEVRIGNSEIDDQVLLKADGSPTYHLANVVDDHAMEITHVIRGEEWITSTPKHILLYQAFGWDLPLFFHLGLLRNADRSKLSKRRNPVSIFHYRDLGYMPETFINFLGTLGFSLGEDRERFTLDEMIEHFDWSRVSTGGPVFDPTKLDAFSGDDIREMPESVLFERIQRNVLSLDRLRPMIPLVRERIDKLDDFVPYVSFFFGGTVDYKPVADKFRLKKRTNKEVADILQLYVDEVEVHPEARTFQPSELEAFSREFCERHQWKTREVFTLLRIAITGRLAAPPLFDTMAVCGKDRCRLRLRDAIRFVKSELD